MRVPDYSFSLPNLDTILKCLLSCLMSAKNDQNPKDGATPSRSTDEAESLMLSMQVPRHHF